jgi:flagellar biosynthetic protein FliQ
MDGADFAVEIGRQALWVALMVGAPVLLAGLVVGVGVSILQAATQVQEPTLTFIPKILAMIGAILLLLPWMLSTVSDFTRELFAAMPIFLR